MAQVEAWLAKRLETEPLIYAAIEGHVYPVYAPAELDYPFITLSRTNTQRRYTMTANDGLPTATFNVNCWDTDYSRLMGWIEHVRQAIDGYRQDAEGFTVRSAFVADESDIPEPPEWAEEQPIYGRQFVLEVRHTETVRTYT